MKTAELEMPRQPKNDRTFFAIESSQSKDDKEKEGLGKGGSHLMMWENESLSDKPI